MARRKIEDELEARRCLRALDAEGVDLRTWARAHGVDGRSLHAWRVNFARWGQGLPRRPQRPHSTRGGTSAGLVELVPATLDQHVLPPVTCSRWAAPGSSSATTSRSRRCVAWSVFFARAELVADGSRVRRHRAARYARLVRRACGSGSTTRTRPGRWPSLLVSQQAAPNRQGDLVRRLGMVRPCKTPGSRKFSAPTGGHRQSAGVHRRLDVRVVARGNRLHRRPTWLVSATWCRFRSIGDRHGSPDMIFTEGWSTSTPFGERTRNSASRLLD